MFLHPRGQVTASVHAPTGSRGGGVMRGVHRWDVGKYSSLFQKGKKGEALKLQSSGKDSQIDHSRKEWVRGNPK